VGDEALAYKNSNNPAIKVVNAFSHPRVIISDFDIAVATLRHFISKIANRPKIVRPFIVIHPLGNIEGEITHVEARALREAGVSAGARKVLVWVGRELSDSELASLQFPTAQGKILEEVPVKKSVFRRR
jgi:rod shape-determining protein MreB